jgi:hypothetical protein
MGKPDREETDMSETKKNNFVDYPEMNGIYRHYKGGLYRVLTMATHSETDEPMVVYQSMLFMSIHVRPLSMWFEIIEKQQEEIITRFTLVKE